MTILSFDKHYNNQKNDIWLRDVTRAEDFYMLTESTFKIFEKSYQKLFFVTFRKIEKAILWTILFPIRIGLIILGVPIYLILSIIFRKYFYKKAKEMSRTVSELEVSIKNGKITKTELKRCHTSIKKFIDRSSFDIDNLKGEKIMKPALESFINEMKKIEKILRVNAYPERNEIVLSYDELRELTLLTDLSF